MHRALRNLCSKQGLAATCAAILTATIAACGVVTSGPERTGDMWDKVRNIDLLPRFPQAQGTTSTGGEETKPQSYYSTASSDAGGTSGASAQVLAPAQRTASGGEGYELNFENTPITTVAKVVLGDIMGLGYTIDPRVQGTVSLASGRPVPKGDILFVLENALRVSNVVMVRDARGYRLIPAAEAVGTGTVDTGNPEAGYGVSVVPLQYVSAPTVLKLLDSFATKPGMVRADPSRNLVLIQGNGAERRSGIDTVLTFDQDWMKGQAVGIYPVRNSAPEPVVAELEKIMDTGEGGLTQNLVKLQPIARQNAIMVVTRKPELLRTAATWITRLDNSDAASTGVKVYRVRYGDAKELAAMLNDMFVGRGGGATFDSPTNQLAPGSGVTAVSSGGAGGLGGGAGGVGGAGGTAGGAGLSSTFSGRQQLAAAIGGGGGTPAGAGGGFGVPGAGGGLGGPATASALANQPGGGGLGTGGLGGGGGGGAAILQGVRITPDVSNNSLLIYANRENYRIIERTLRELDRPPMQVAIEATIAEVTLNNNLAYGVQVFLQSSDLGLGRNKGSIDLVNLAAAIPARSLPGFNFLVGSETTPRVILSALQTVTDVKVLSNPSLVVLDNRVATLQVGDQIPVTTQSAVSVQVPTAPIVNNIDYRNTGIILRVQPRISSNGNVLLDIEQEISNPSGGGLTPTISQRRVKSTISVASGQTVLLGGLIREQVEKDKSGLPLLDRLGPLGELLGDNHGSLQRTELIMFIRPQIIRSTVDAHQVAEELRTRMGNRYGTYEPVLPHVLPRTPESAR
jgi:general secretion pathway protein D